MIGALGYLIVTSTRNSMLSRIRRVRDPRYAIALLLGLGYFWLVFFRPSAVGGRDASTSATAIGFGAFIGLTMFLTAAYAWIFGADRSALAFSQAEVAMLFPGPISRRALIVYKLVRAQGAVLTTTVLWVFVFRRGDAGLTALVSLWVLLTTIALHRLGVALLHVSRREHGLAAVRRNWIAATVFALIAATVVGGLYAARAQFAQVSDIERLPAVLGEVIARPPVSWALLPFRITAAPSFLRGSAEWPRAFLLAVVLMLAHVWWVLHSDTAFEEAAAEASAAQARRLQALRTQSLGRGVTRIKGARRTIPLAPVGMPAVAIVWKNLLWLLRTGQLRGLIGLPLIFAGAAFFSRRSETALEVVAIICGVTVALAILFGPMTMRNDLRAELLNLPMLKTLPLRGRHIMAAEVLSSASPTAALQVLILGVAVAALSFVPDAPIPGAVRLQLLFAAPVLLLGLNVANFSIHNGLALLFPAWVRTGDANPGIEMMGQMMLTLIVTMAMLLVMSILPSLIGGVVFSVLQFQHLPAFAGGGIAAGAAFLVESYLVLTMLGGSLDKLEPMHMG